LSAFLSETVSPGFDVLVRYVDELCRLHNVSVVPVTVRMSFSAAPAVDINLDVAVLVAQTRRSIVLRPLPDAPYVVKLSSFANVDRERRIHTLVDDHQSAFLRQSLGNVSVGGVPGLAGVVLAGFGRPLVLADVKDSKQAARFFENACCAIAHLHAHNVLHGDVKPSNFLVFEDDGDQVGTLCSSVCVAPFLLVCFHRVC
jgi:hypothetical protein